MADKIGLYICKGCGIGESLDIDQLSEVAREKAAVVQSHDMLCSNEGVQLIKNDIENEGVTKVSIAACSPRVKYEVFDFGPGLVDRINIREQCVWCHPANEEDTQMLAEDYVRMGLVKLEKSSPAEPYRGEEELVSDLLVVGGGITGMTSALEAAKAGYAVHLVEKEEALGGFWRKMYKSVSPPYKDLTDIDVDQMIAEIEGNDKITVYTNSSIEKIEGAPGMFDVSIAQNGNSAAKRSGRHCPGNRLETVRS